MESFGNKIRKLRESQGLLLREVASRLAIDPSLLSRIECGKKRATRAQVVQLASILSTDENELIIFYLSDNLLSELEGEKLAIHAMSVAEERIRYMTLKSKESLKSVKKKAL